MANVNKGEIVRGYASVIQRQVRGEVYQIYSNGVGVLTPGGIVLMDDGEYEKEDVLTYLDENGGTYEESVMKELNINLEEEAQRCDSANSLLKRLADIGYKALEEGRMTYSHLLSVR